MQDAKIGVIKGKATIGYGESLVNVYCNLKDGTYELKLRAGSSRCGSIMFDSLEQLLAVTVELKKGFRITK